METLAIVAIIVFGIRGAMRAWEVADDPPEVREAGNKLGWLIALVLGTIVAGALLSAAAM